MSRGKKSLPISPKPERPDPEAYINPPIPDPALAGPPPQLPAGYGRWREYRYDPSAMVIPAPAWLEGGSLSGWRSGGVSSRDREHSGGGGGGPGAMGFGPAGGGGGGGGGDRYDASAGGGGGGGGGGAAGGRKGGFTKDLSTVLCFVSDNFP